MSFAKAGRKPATSLEERVSAGIPVDPDELIAAIDRPMNDALVYAFRNDLDSVEREDLIRDVIVELMCFQPPKYDVKKASLVGYAKLRVVTLGRQYLRKRRQTPTQEKLFNEQGYLRLAVEESAGSSPDPADLVGNTELIALLLPFVTSEIAALNHNERKAAEAYRNYGAASYASKLAAEIGVSNTLVAQWWCRAKSRILDRIQEIFGTDIEISD